MRFIPTKKIPNLIVEQGKRFKKCGYVPSRGCTQLTGAAEWGEELCRSPGQHPDQALYAVGNTQTLTHAHTHTHTEMRQLRKTKPNQYKTSQIASHKSGKNILLWGWRWVWCACGSHWRWRWPGAEWSHTGSATTWSTASARSSGAERGRWRWDIQDNIREIFSQWIMYDLWFSGYSFHSMDPIVSSESRITSGYLSISVQRREVEEERLSQRDTVDWVVQIVALVKLHLDKRKSYESWSKMFTKMEQSAERK